MMMMMIVLTILSDRHDQNAYSALPANERSRQVQSFNTSRREYFLKTALGQHETPCEFTRMLVVHGPLLSSGYHGPKFYCWQVSVVGLLMKGYGQQFPRQRMGLQLPLDSGFQLPSFYLSKTAPASSFELSYPMLFILVWPGSSLRFGCACLIVAVVVAVVAAAAAVVVVAVVVVVVVIGGGGGARREHKTVTRHVRDSYAEGPGRRREFQKR